MQFGGRFRYAADPDMPGWHIWEASAAPVFNAAFEPIRIRREKPEVGRVRVWPRADQANVGGGVHGGFIVAFIDMALAAGVAGARDGEVPALVTVELTNQFVAPAKIGIAIDAVVEIIRETRRMFFLRGTLEQDGAVVAVFSAISNKARLG